MEELLNMMVFYGKDYILLTNNLFRLYYGLKFGFPKYNYDEPIKIIKEYCEVYDIFQKLKIKQRLPEITVCKNPITEYNSFIDIKLSEPEYKLCEQFLLKQLNLNSMNVRKIEHYPKRGFLRRI